MVQPAMQPGQAATERFLVSRRPGALFDGGGHQQVGFDQDDGRRRWSTWYCAQSAQAPGFVGCAGADLGHQGAIARLHQPGRATQPSGPAERTGHRGQAWCPARRIVRAHCVTLASREAGAVEHNGRVPARGPAGLILTPGASARRDQSGLVAIDDESTTHGLTVERVEFPGQASGKRRTDPPAVCIEIVRNATGALAERLSVPTRRIAIGGRSFGGRMCSLAVADGLDVAALVLVSYPLHPPGKPERLRTEHFPHLHVPCLFVSGRKDAFATPAELEREIAVIPGPVTVSFVEGDHSLRRSETEVAAIVASWLTGLSGRQRR